MEFQNRINSLRSTLSKTDIDTAFISNKDNIRYYSGFTGTLAFLPLIRTCPCTTA